MYRKVQKMIYMTAAAMILGCLSGCATQSAAETTEPETFHPADSSFSASDLEVGYDESAATQITCMNAMAQITGSGAEIADGVITITQGGIYVLSGSLSGQLRVDAANQEVQLVLNGVSITSQNGPALWVEQAEKTVVLLPDGTENSLTDGQADEEDKEANACLYAQSDLTVNGEGTLYVAGNRCHGIFCKGTLSITGGTFHVTAENDGVKGKDGIKILMADMTIQAGGDGIQSNEDQLTDLGYVSIGGGTFQIVAAADGIQAESTLCISGGTFHITTGGGSAQAPQKNSPEFRSLWEQASAETEGSEATGAKGLKAGSAIEISGGTFQIDALDDAVHSNGTLDVSGGELTISSGDDGFHSDGPLTISGGTVQIDSSYEGIEGLQITISGGTIALKASDDGLNAAGGSDENGNFSRDHFFDQGNSECWIRITGGNLEVDAGGDGIDSNGGLYMDGGTVYVSGPTSSGDGALDYGSAAEITGGTIFAVGSNGMAAGFGNTSSQHSFLIVFSQLVTGGTELIVTDADGKVIGSYTPAKDYQSAVISTPELQLGNTYTVTAGTQTEEITLTGITTTSGRISGMPGRPDGNSEQDRPGGITPPNMGEPPAGWTPGDPPPEKPDWNS
ncbi:MAG: carbohydrate-binding domain-containing protein [Faecalispora jeddahensis]